MVCRDCGKKTAPNRFATYRDRSGRIRRRRLCQICYSQHRYLNRTKRRALTAQKIARHRKAIKDFLAKAKDVPCVDCKLRFPVVAMDFDHVIGKKFKAISVMASSKYSLELIKNEIKKCEVVCACCHRIRTHARGQSFSPARNPKRSTCQ